MKFSDKNLLMLLGLCMGLAQSLWAQQIRVLDHSDLRPVNGVLIYAQGKVHKQVTTGKGEANVSAFAEGDTLYFSHLSFQMLRVPKSALAAQGYTVYLTEKVVNLEELVFSANKEEEARRELPQRIELIDQKQVAFYNPATTGDLLRQTGNVFVQTSQAGGGSPVLRGFEASRVLMVIDGVRMNNAIYRAGHLQNIITIDPNILEKAEVVFGPGSVIYGSDALGGVMHFFTRKPEFAEGERKFLVKGSAFARYASATNERATSAQLNLGGRKLASFSSFTYKDLGDVRAGSVRPQGYPDSWKRNVTADVIDGRNVAVPNPDPNLQTSSGYVQWDALQKLVYKPHDDNIFTLNVQYSNSSIVPRYDRLSETTASGLPVFGSWDYGPQTRLMASLKAEFKSKTDFYDNASVIVAYQNVYEDRRTRRFTSFTRTHREERVRVLSLNADLGKNLSPRNELRYGLEVTYNNVNSQAYNQHIITGALSPASTRYPDGGNEMQSFAAYLTHAWEMNEAKSLIFSQGLRYNYVSLHSQFNEKAFFPFPYSEATQRNSALTGNMGLVWSPQKAWRFSLMAASGFRSPNVDDLGKVFDSQPGSVIVPNPDIKPEYTYNLDLTVGYQFNERLAVELTGFHTWFANAIAVRPFRFNGQDSVVYDGRRSRVLANINVNRATIAGFQANIKAQLTKFLALQSSLSYTHGWVHTNGVPLDHVPPLFGQTSLKAEIKRFKAELWGQYNGWKRLKDYSPSGEDNLQYATPDGMPAWWTLNLRTAFQVNRYAQVQLAVENILDKHYRYFSSGISAPGRNFMATARFNF